MVLLEALEIMIGGTDGHLKSPTKIQKSLETGTQLRNINSHPLFNDLKIPLPQNTDKITQIIICSFATKKLEILNIVG